MTKAGYTANEVTIRHVRRMLCEEISQNPAILKAIEDAAGGNLIALLGGVDMSRHGADMHLTFATHRGQAGLLRIDLQLDELRGGDIFLLDRDRTPVIRRDRRGLDRRVTIAPWIWFRHSGNAESAVNPLCLEDLVTIASPEVSAVLYHGITRTRDRFKALAKPKREVPRWVYATR